MTLHIPITPIQVHRTAGEPIRKGKKGAETENHFIFSITENPLQLDYEVQQRLEGMCCVAEEEKRRCKRNIVSVLENNSMARPTDRTT